MALVDICLGFSFFFVMCVYIFGSCRKSGDKSTLRFIIEAARKKLLVAWILCTLLFFLFVYIIAWKHFGEDSHKASLYMELLYERIGDKSFSFGDYCGIAFVLLFPMPVR